ncbi:MAG TPA: RagB/SusD family nutrient uptake outer membrane protein [Puia sp.]|nr:RagB/SusD family nutrient uptake outer membrane protein [Puia sp.]
MNRIKNICQYLFAILLGAVALFTSCSKNLNQTPRSTATNEAVFGSQQGLQLYANSFYDSLPLINDLYKVDAGVAGSDYAAQSSAPSYLIQGAFSSRQATGWNWSKLRNINYFIANCTNPAVPQSVRENFLGLARFFRAYFYYGMVQKFGNVPWIGRPLGVNDPALYAGRDARTLVMDSVLADINYAITHITMATADPTSSQITKWVAYGLKSRICLFEGTFRRYQTSYNLTGSAAQWLQDAASAAKAVMDSSGYTLNTSGGVSQAYRNLFISTSPVNTEVMLSIVSSAALAVLNDANWYFTSATYGSRFSLTRTFINTYLNLDGSRFTDLSGHDTLPFVKETVGRDLRLSQTIRTPGYSRISSGKTIPAPPVFSYSYTGYQPIKWCLDDTYYDNGTLNINSICLMRYAEILLNYAEAQAELGLLTAPDWTKTIGALRARAGITGGLSSLPTIADPYLEANYFPDITDPVLLEIRRERGIELTMEGFRFADLIRWKHGELLGKPWNGMYVPALNQLMDLNGDGVYDVCFYETTPPSPQVSGVTYINVAATINGVANPQRLSNDTYGELHWLDNVTRDWEDYKYLYPVPYGDLLLNPNLGQNPQWQ